MQSGYNRTVCCYCGRVISESYGSYVRYTPCPCMTRNDYKVTDRDTWRGWLVFLLILVMSLSGFIWIMETVSKGG